MNTILSTTMTPAGGSDTAAIITTLVLAVIGMVLWIAGRRILRGSFALVGLGLGGVIGVGAGSAFELGIPPWAIGIVVGVILACVAAFAYRAVLAGALALILGTAFPLGVWTALDVQQYITEQQSQESPELATADDPVQEPVATPRAADDFDVSWIFDGLRRLGEDPSLHGTDPADDRPPELLRNDNFYDDDASPGNFVESAVADELAEQGRTRLGDAAEGLGLDRQRVDNTINNTSDFVEQLWAGFGEVWDQTPAKVQKTLMAACVLGVLLGLLTGLALPGITAATVTASGGSLLWLSMSVGLLGQLGVSLSSWMPNRPSQWIAIWTMATLIGLLIQWTISRKKSDKSPKRANG